MTATADAPPRGLPVGAVLQSIGIGVVVGFLAGVVVGGIGSRIAMYISGLLTDPAVCPFLLTGNGFRCGVFTVSGTVALLVTGAFGGIFGGLIYAAVRPWVPGSSKRRRGLIFGTALLAAAGPAVIDANNVDFRRFGPPTVNVAMYAVLYPLFGLMLVPLYERLERFVQSARVWGWIVSGVGSIGVVLAGLSLVAGTAFLVGERELDALVFFTVAVASFVVLPLVRFIQSRREDGTIGRTSPGSARAPVRYADRVPYAVIAVAITVGSIGTAHNIWRIVG